MIICHSLSGRPLSGEKDRCEVMKIGIDLGNKTFTVMRIENNEVEIVPNLYADYYGESDEAIPAIFSYQDGQWGIVSEKSEHCIAGLMSDPNKIYKITNPDEELTIHNKEGLVAALSLIRKTIETNNPGDSITEAIFAIPKDYPELSSQFASAMKKAGWPIHETDDSLDEKVAALFGSGGWDNLKEHIGSSRTVLVLDGRTNELSARVYTVTVTENMDGSIHMDLYALSGQKYEGLGGYKLEKMMASRLKQIAAEQSNLPIDEFEEHEWLNLVDYVKDQFLIEPAPYIAYNFQFSDGTPWEEPESIDSGEVYAVFRGEASFKDTDGQTYHRNVKQELQDFLYELCDEGGITTEQIDDIIMAGGTFRLPFWRETIQSVLPHANAITPPDYLSETSLIGRGCAKFIQWREQHQFTYNERKKSGNYIGIGYFNEESNKVSPDKNQSGIFKPLIVTGQGQAEKSALNLFEIPKDQPLVLHVYRGPQTDELYKCEKITTLRFLHSFLEKQAKTNHVGLRFIADTNNVVFYELTHPYTEDVIEKGEVPL